MYFGWLILAAKKGRFVMFDLGLSTSSSGVDAGTKETLKAVDRQGLEMRGTALFLKNCRTLPSNHWSVTWFDCLRMGNGGHHHSLSYWQQAKTLFRIVQFRR